MEEIDKENGDNLWEDAIKQEMKNSRVAFQAYDGDIKDLIGYEQITCHLIFDVKLSECFRRKARFVADGHKVMCLVIVIIVSLQLLAFVRPHVAAPGERPTLLRTMWSWSGLSCTRTTPPSPPCATAS